MKPCHRGPGNPGRGLSASSPGLHSQGPGESGQHRRGQSVGSAGWWRGWGPGTPRRADLGDPPRE